MSYCLKVNQSFISKLSIKNLNKFWIGLGAKSTQLVSLCFIVLISFYQLGARFVFWGAPTCRFVPSCSEYSKSALMDYGPILGLYFSLKRIVKCRPGGSSGFDPVPRKG